MRSPRFSGHLLRQRRLRAGHTQAELARRSNVREIQIARWENEHHQPRADAIGALATALECDVSDLFDHGSSSDDEDEDEDMVVRRVAAELVHRGDDVLADVLLSALRRRRDTTSTGSIS